MLRLDRPNMYFRTDYSMQYFRSFIKIFSNNQKKRKEVFLVKKTSQCDDHTPNRS